MLVLSGETLGATWPIIESSASLLKNTTTTELCSEKPPTFGTRKYTCEQSYCVHTAVASYLTIVI